MRVLVAGATGDFGPFVMRALRSAGHSVVGLTRTPVGAARIEESGAEAVVADVFDREWLRAAVARAEPEVVVSLLITLPKLGAWRSSQVYPNLRLWGEGVPNLIAAARSARARRLVAESFVFAYGYGQYGPKLLTEADEPAAGGVIAGQAEIVAGLRHMEKTVVAAEDLEGIALRYGARHGAGLSMTMAMTKALRFGLPVLPGGGHALMPFIEIGDAASATVAALTRGDGGEIYNVVDDQPAEIREYAAALSAVHGFPSPRSIPLPLVKAVAPYMACVLDHSRLPVSNTKAKRALGWEPRYPTLRDAIADAGA